MNTKQFASALFSVTVPSTYNGGYASVEFVSDCIAMVTKAMSDIFGGCTKISANGIWYDSEGVAIEENVVIVTSWGDDTPDNRNAVNAIAAELQDVMKQECVLWSIQAGLAFLV